MSERPNSHMKITVDIETFGGTTKPTADDVQVPANYKNPETIAKYIENELPGLYNKQALNSLKGEIVCIGLAKDNEDVEVLYRNGPEKELMEQFNTWLLDNGVVKQMTQVYWVGKNLFGFDLPWLLHRSWKYKLPLIADLIPMKKYDEHIIDIQLLFPGPDTQKYYKLDDIAKYLGLGGKEGMTGAEVPQAYIDGRHDEISRYCANDVKITREIAKIIQPWNW